MTRYIFLLYYVHILIEKKLLILKINHSINCNKDEITFFFFQLKKPWNISHLRSLKWKFCLWYLDLINETWAIRGNSRRNRVFHKRFHYALFFCVFNWIRERARELAGKARKFMRHSLVGFSFETVSRIIHENEFPDCGSERRPYFPNFSHHSVYQHRWSRKSPAIAE